MTGQSWGGAETTGRSWERAEMTGIPVTVYILTLGPNVTSFK